MLGFAQATSVPGRMSLADRVATTEVIVQGTVVSVAGCRSSSGDQAHTFSQILVGDTLLGDWQPRPGEPADRLTVHLPRGTYADGSFSSFLDTPRLELGDEIVALLQYSPAGIPKISPVGAPRQGMYRVVDLGDAGPGHGETAVLDGEGHLMMIGEAGVYAGPQVPGARAIGPFDAPFDESAVAETLLEMAALVTPPSQGEPWEGRWRGTASILVEDASTQEAGRCSATMRGEVAETGLIELLGSCNLPYLGAVDIHATGSLGASGWDLDVAVKARRDGTWVRSFSTSGAPMGSDVLSASLAHQEVLGGTPYTATVRLAAAFDGPQTFATRDDVLAMLADLVDLTDAPGGTGRSVGPDPMSCNAPFLTTSLD